MGRLDSASNPRGIQIQIFLVMAWLLSCAGGEITILVSRDTELRRITVHDSGDVIDEQLQLNSIQFACDVDYDPVDGKFYWSDAGTHVISRANLDGTDQEVVVSSGLESPYGIAVDSKARTLYWTDNDLEMIEAARLDGSSRTVVTNTTDVSPPIDIEIDSVSGHLYWTTRLSIVRANLDGSDPIVTVSDDGSTTGLICGLALDIPDGKMYWANLHLEKIEVANLDGSDRRVLVYTTSPYYVAILGDYLYWTTYNNPSIQRVIMNKRTGVDPTTVIRYESDRIRGIKVVDLSAAVTSATASSTSATPSSTAETTASSTSATPSSKTENTDGNNRSGSDSTGLYVGIAVASMAVLVLVMVGVVIFMLRRIRKLSNPAENTVNTVNVEPDHEAQSAEVSNPPTSGLAYYTELTAITGSPYEQPHPYDDVVGVSNPDPPTSGLSRETDSGRPYEIPHPYLEAVDLSNTAYETMRPTE